MVPPKISCTWDFSFPVHNGQTQLHSGICSHSRTGYAVSADPQPLSWHKSLFPVRHLVCSHLLCPLISVQRCIPVSGTSRKRNRFWLFDGLVHCLRQYPPSHPAGNSLSLHCPAILCGATGISRYTEVCLEFFPDVPAHPVVSLRKRVPPCSC